MRRCSAVVFSSFILMFFVFLPVAAASAADSDVTIDAADMEYDMDAKAVRASGNVVLRGTNLEIRCDEMVYYDNGWVEVTGKSYIKNDYGEFEGDDLKYNINTKNGELKNVRGRERGYFVNGKIGTISPDGESIQDGKVTRCNLPRPCYQLHAGRIRFQNGRLIVERGYLSLLGVPVLPVLYLNLNLEKLDDWPELDAGQDKTRGFYVTALERYALSSKVSSYGQVGLGTNQWALLGGGLTWNAVPDLSVSGSVSKEWGENDKAIGNLTGNWTFWRSDGQSLFIQVFNEEQTVKDDGLRGDGTLSGVRLYYSSGNGLMMSLGMINSRGDDWIYGPEGWGTGATLYWNRQVGRNWKLTINGSYKWDNAGNWWLTKEISLTRYFHCISTKIGWDGVENQWRYSVGIRW